MCSATVLRGLLRGVALSFAGVVRRVTRQKLLLKDGLPGRDELRCKLLMLWSSSCRRDVVHHGEDTSDGRPDEGNDIVASARSASLGCGGWVVVVGSFPSSTAPEQRALYPRIFTVEELLSS